MDFDKIKQNYKQVKAPDTGAEVTKDADVLPAKEDSMNVFIERMKKQDLEDKKNAGTLMIFTSILIAGFVGWNLLGPGSKFPLYAAVGTLLIITALVVSIFLSQRNRKKLSAVDYDSPTLEFLARAEERLKYLSKEGYIAIPFVLLIDIGVSIQEFGRDVTVQKALTNVLFLQGMFVVIAVFSFFLTRHLWRQSKLPLLEKVRELKKTFEEE